jgi:hypothetical protein
MKCSICNAENPPEATICHQCGFSLTLSQPAWPDFPTVDIPKPIDTPMWPEVPPIDVPPPPKEPVWPESGDLTKTVGDADDEGPGVPEAVESHTAPPPIEADVAPPEEPTDDELARFHITRGFEAIREGLLGQARWEFEQARDLADDVDIVHMAQSQLDSLFKTTTEPVREQARSVGRPPSASAPRSIAIRGGAMDWQSVVRVGVIIGALSGVLTGCSAIVCLGFLLVPLSGFVAGWVLARRRANVRPAADRDSQMAEIVQAVVVGAIAGAGGWLGQVIGYPIWLASLYESGSEPQVWPFVACVSGAFVPLATATSVLGWRIGARRERRNS